MHFTWLILVCGCCLWWQSVVVRSRVLFMVVEASCLASTFPKTEDFVSNSPRCFKQRNPIPDLRLSMCPLLFEVGDHCCSASFQLAGRRTGCGKNASNPKPQATQIPVGELWEPMGPCGSTEDVHHCSWFPHGQRESTHHGPLVQHAEFATSLAPKGQPVKPSFYMAIMAQSDDSDEHWVLQRQLFRSISKDSKRSVSCVRIELHGPGTVLQPWCWHRRSLSHFL